MLTQCDGCAFAEWKRTKKGYLHPDKTGRCTYLDKHPLDLRLPRAFYWMYRPSPGGGGFIMRGVKFEDGCDFRQEAI